MSNEINTNEAKIYNPEEYKDIQHKHFIKDVGIKELAEIAKLAKENGVKCSARIEGDKATVTLDGEKKDFIKTAHSIIDNKEQTALAKEDDVSYFNKQGYGKIKNKFHITCDKKTAAAISKMAESEKVQHSVKWTPEKAVVCLDGDHKDLCFKALNFAKKQMPENTVEHKANKMAEWADKAADKAELSRENDVQQKNNSR